MPITASSSVTSHRSSTSPSRVQARAIRGRLSTAPAPVTTRKRSSRETRHRHVALDSAPGVQALRVHVRLPRPGGPRRCSRPAGGSRGPPGPVTSSLPNDVMSSRPTRSRTVRCSPPRRAPSSSGAPRSRSSAPCPPAGAAREPSSGPPQPPHSPPNTAPPSASSRSSKGLVRSGRPHSFSPSHGNWGARSSSGRPRAPSPAAYRRSPRWAPEAPGAIGLDVDLGVSPSSRARRAPCRVRPRHRIRSGTGRPPSRSRVRPASARAAGCRRVSLRPDGTRAP